MPLLKGEKPGAITDYSVKNLAGASEITYVVPDDKTMYVEAEYEIAEGIRRDAKSSKYGKTINVEGFPAAGEYNVTLYAVGRDDQRSEPLVISVAPYDPPVVATFETLRIEPDFSGIKISAENTFESNLVIGVLTSEDSSANLSVVEQHYTSSKNVRFSLRGYEAKPRRFGVFIRDQWLNHSDTLFAEITPLFEEKIDMSRFYETNFPGDQWENHQVGATRSISKLFDGKKGSQTQGYYSVLNSGMPQHFTIYLQGVYQLSRLKWWQTAGSYASANPRKFRVWGSIDPNPNGDMDSTWILLGEFENIKPSGLPVGIRSDEDIARAQNGDEVSFGVDLPAVSYIRFETLETWGLNQAVYITEMEFWGTKE